MGTDVVLSVSGLKKRIKGKWIIKGVSFEVGRGEIFGFLGPNGSGKTTTIRMLVGLIKPTEGTIVLAGRELTREPTEALRHVGCIVENPELYGYMTGQENLEHFARMIPGVTAERIREVTAIVGLEQRIGDKVHTYSLGMRQRLGIAQALLGRPSLLILDEPTNGLDPQGIKEMREFIRQLASEGLSLFVSSHLLSEIQQMCDRVAIISHGEVLAVGGVEELLSTSGTTVQWEAEPAERVRSLLARHNDVELLEELPASEQEEDESRLRRTVTVRMNEERIPEINEALVFAGVRVHAIRTVNPTLEELFLRVTEGERIE